MADPKKMIRTDGTRVAFSRHPSWKSEIVGLWVALRTDPYILLLFPMFLASNWFTRGAGLAPEAADVQRRLQELKSKATGERMSEQEALEKVAAKRKVKLHDLVHLGGTRDSFD